MKDDRSLNLMINDIGQRNREDLKKEIGKEIKEVREEYEPPMIPMTSDFNYDDWERELMRL